MQALYLILMIILTATLYAFPVSGQVMRCGDRAELIKSLSEKYKEKPFAVGVNANGTAFELLVSKTGTYTVLSTTTSGVSCLVLSGDSFNYAPPEILAVIN